MDMGIEGKRALVLASSRGLGLGIAEALAREGAKVMLCGRSGERLRAACEAINGRGGGQAVFATVDLSDPKCAAALFEAATEKLGGVDILVNNTGGPPPGPITGFDTQTWRAQFDAMVLRIFEITNLCLPAMREAGWGRVLSVGSSGVQQPIPNMGMSNTVRSALVGWTKTLAAEVAGDGVTVNMLLPGRIHTQRTDELNAAAAKRQNKTVEEIAEASRAAIPAGRYGRVEEFADVAAFLCGAPSSYVTGSMIRCDGGAIRGV